MDPITQMNVLFLVSGILTGMCIQGLYQLNQVKYCRHMMDEAYDINHKLVAEIKRLRAELEEED